MYKQRDIVLVNFPFTDLSGAKLRPALILSSNQVNKKDEYVCVQITSKFYEDGLFVEVKNSDVVTVLKLKSGIRLHKIFTAEKKIMSGKISEMTEDAFSDILKAINKLVF